MLEKLFNLFRKKPVQQTIPDTTPATPVEQTKYDLFHCHYCHHGFEVTSKMQFPTSVLSVGKEYIFQGIGVLCPKCFKTCIYG